MRPGRRLAPAFPLLVVTSCTGTISGGAGGETQATSTTPGGGEGAIGGGGESTPGAMAEATEPLHFHPRPAGVRRLSQVQYGNAIRDLLGSSIVVPVDVIPRDETYRFANVGSYRGTSGSDVVEGYSTAAVDVAHQALSVATNRAAFVGCSPQSVDDPCLGVFLANFGRRVLRRPLTPEELDIYRGVVKAGAAAGKVWSGVEYVVAALLQDASFLYMPLVG